MINKIRENFQLNTEVFEVECDDCDHVQEYEVDFGWTELLEKMKADGWVNRKVNKEWENYCGNCAEQRKE